MRGKGSLRYHLKWKSSLQHELGKREKKDVDELSVVTNIAHLISLCHATFHPHLQVEVYLTYCMSLDIMSVKTEHLYINIFICSFLEKGFGISITREKTIVYPVVYANAI